MSVAGTAGQRLGSAALACLLMAACGDDASQPGDSPAIELPGTPLHGDLPEIRKRRTLRALVVPGPADFFLDGGELKGLQVEYLEAFMRHLNRDVRNEAARVRLEYVPASMPALLPALAAGHGDIAAHLLIASAQPADTVRYISGFRVDAAEVVVTHASVEPLQALSDLAGRRVVVPASSSYAQHLRALSARLEADGLDRIRIEHPFAPLRSDELLVRVNNGDIDITVMADYRARLWAGALDQLRIADHLVVHETAAAGWAVRGDAPELAASVEAFTAAVRRGTTVGNVMFNRYYVGTRWIERVAAAANKAPITQHMPLFQRFGDQYDLDPLLLAAQAFHESGLKQKARNASGAVGIMQVRPATASDHNIAVTGIDKVENNVHAGTKYLAFLRDRYFTNPEITERDRVALSLAAYNAGPATVRRARKRAADMGLDENVWFGNVEVAMSEIAGFEPVRYVRKVSSSHSIYQRLLEGDAEAESID